MDKPYTYEELVERLKAGKLTPEEFERLAEQLSEQAATAATQTSRDDTVAEQRIKTAAKKARAL